MHATGSVLLSIIEKIRLCIDEPVAKYTDDLLVRQFIPQAWAETLSMLKMTGDSLPIVVVPLSIVSGTSRYILPSWIDSIIRLVRRSSSDSSYIDSDYVPSSLYARGGCGWRIEANEIVFDPIPQETLSIEAWVVPSGDLCLHTGTGAVTSSTQIVLAATPTLGLLDRRINAYAGCVLRIVQSNRTWQERVISAYDPTTRTATVITAFVQDSNNLPANAAPVAYEIAPLGQRCMIDALAWKVALMMGTIRKMTQKDLMAYDIQYQRSMKSVFDRAKVQRRIASHLDKRTVDNTDLSRYDVWAFEV